MKIEIRISASEEGTSTLTLLRDGQMRGFAAIAGARPIVQWEDPQTVAMAAKIMAEFLKEMETESLLGDGLMTPPVTEEEEIGMYYE